MYTLCYLPNGNLEELSLRQSQSRPVAKNTVTGMST